MSESKVISIPQYNSSASRTVPFVSQVIRSPDTSTRQVHHLIPGNSQIHQRQVFNVDSKTCAICQSQKAYNTTCSICTNHYGKQSRMKYSRISEADTDFLVYCPVCKTDYFNSQVYSHMRKHYVADSYNFSSTHEPSTMITQPSVFQYQSKSYPLVEPLQFYTNELDEVAQSDKFKFILNQNFDQFQNQQEPALRQEINVQTPNKPPLQYIQRKTNLYNCFDNMVNAETFSGNDLWKYNQGLAAKRDLSEWEYLALGNKR